MSQSHVPTTALGTLQLHLGSGRKALGAVGFLCAVAVLCGLYLHPRVFALALALLGVLALGVLWPSVTIPALRGTLRFAAARGREGEPVRVWAEVRNHLPWSAWSVTVQGGFMPESAGPAAGVAVVPGCRTAALTWDFVPPRRGVYPLISPWLATAFPFGLYEVRRTLAVAAPLLVWPSTFPVGPLPALLGEHADGEAAALRRAGTLGDLLGVRPYRHGDSPRRVHWPQTARHERLITREVESSARPVAHVLLDDNQMSHTGPAPDGSREWAIRIAASYCEAWLTAGGEVGATFGGRSITAAAGAAHRRTLLDALARLTDAGGPPLADALAHLSLAARPGPLIVVTTDRGLAALPPGRVASRARFVVLQADAFAGPPGFGPPRAPAGLPVRPWRWVNDPAQVSEQLRGNQKGAADDD